MAKTRTEPERAHSWVDSAGSLGVELRTPSGPSLIIIHRPHPPMHRPPVREPWKAAGIRHAVRAGPYRPAAQRSWRVQRPSPAIAVPRRRYRLVRRLQVQLALSGSAVARVTGRQLAEPAASPGPTAEFPGSKRP
jgi:hypothetical protein